MFDRDSSSPAYAPPLIERSATFGKVCLALAKAQGNFAEVVKSTPGQDGNRRFFYADLGAIRTATAPALAAEGLALFCGVSSELSEDGSTALVSVQTELVHGESSEWLRTPTLVLEVPASAVKQMGGTSSYFRRYQAQTLLGIAAETDNDQEHDGARPVPPPPAQDRGPLSPGEDPPSMSGPTTGNAEADARAAIASQNWRGVLAAIGRLPTSSALRRTLQEEYQATRYPKNGSTTPTP